MAHIVLTAVVNTTINQLTTYGLQEILLLYKFKKELKRLKATTGAIGNVLQDAEERQAKEQLVLGWLERVKAVMYDADDLLDRVRFRALQKKAMPGNSFIKEVRFFLSESNHIGFVFRTSHRVEEIRKTLDHISEDMRALNFIPHRREDARHERIRGEETYSFVREDEVFGREEERTTILTMLLQQDEGESSSREAVATPYVFTIIGFGGLGKTTLAKLVYNDELVKRKFDVRLWVCINYLSNMTQVLKAIIESSGRKPVNLDFEQLQRQLTGIVSGKKVLLVMDNIWEEDRSRWVDLKATLDGCNIGGSRILVTTRSKVVAEKADALKPYYELQALSEKSATSLFVKMAFTNIWEQESDPDLETMVSKVVRKCGCVPLALITIGSLLRRKEKRWWLQYIESQLPEVVKYNENGMAQALRISYDDLPTNLKPCFTYCSLFPKDYLFDKDMLVRLWLSQGFIKSDSRTWYGGENSFLYLLERCFFQEVQVVESHGALRYRCKMHDLLHDLAIEVAGEEYLVLEKVFPELEEKVIRHMAFDCELDALDDYPHLFYSSKALRTLICSSKAIGGYSLSRSFKMLRALDLSRTKLVKIPKSIGELIQMRYLNLSDNEDLVSLPGSICNLLYLQTLDLSWCKSLAKLPSKIGNLTTLSCLLLNGCISLTYLPQGISSLTSLVSLDRVVVHQKHGGLSYLGRMKKLCGSLSIELPMRRWEKMIEDASKSNFSEKPDLDGLVLAWREPEISPSGDERLSPDEVDQVLEVLKPHENLEYLKITGCGASKLPTWVSSHQNIKELNLECWHEMQYMEDTVKPNSFFRRLDTLAINDMDNLKGWWPEVATDEEGQPTRVPSFPRVKKVVINRCPNFLSEKENRRPKLEHRMPLFSQIEELTLGHVDCAALRQLLTVSMNGSNRLRKLKLERIRGLEYLLDIWIGHLTALRTLEVTSCDEIKWVSRSGLQHLTNLEELVFEECGEVKLIDEYGDMEDDEGLPWEALQKLRILKLPVWEMHFANGIQHLTELEELAIYSWQQQEEEEDAATVGEMDIVDRAQNLTAINWNLPQFGEDDYDDDGDDDIQEQEDAEAVREMDLVDRAQNLTELEALGVINRNLPQFGEDDYDDDGEDDIQEQEDAEAVMEMDLVERAQNLTELEALGVINWNLAQFGEDDYDDDGDDDIQEQKDAETVREMDLVERAQNLTELEDSGVINWQLAQFGEDDYDNDGDDDDGDDIDAGARGETSCSWKHLTSLHKLTIGFDQKSCRFPQQIQHLSSLEHLVITDCRRLSSIWIAISNLRQLQSLTFCRVENVIQEDFTEPPHSLTCLKFDECHGGLGWMNHIPWESLRSLHSLALVDMPDLKFLPQGIHNLNSLQELTIMKCQNLPSLPDWMNKLSSLRSLVIAICSDKLNESCTQQPTADRIRLIPHVNIW